ncbi:hypothetical protein OG949_17860 [Streptomyces scopuliridis]|uniref:hypothetical protein n=1 Tax=Streptomyces scopuliridis TaxID=452529 RepID=UPI002DDA6F5C|nr:hypothetical protein [Streptomyces scopuliridis]WSB34555.1 hypothetical protein OG949_17860 [Streptomyces scopuliridis]
MADRHGLFLQRVVALLKRCVPPPALTGFLVLLVVVFGVSYAVGSAVGPVAPGMHSTDTGPRDPSDSTPGGDTGDMDGMHSDGGR